MRLFLKKISFFLIPVFIGWFCIEIFYREVPNNYTVKNEGITAVYDKAEVLFLGNSHSFYGLNPKYCKRQSFNLSNISQTLMYDELLFEKHLDSLKRLKCLIITVEYSSLGQADDIDELNWRKYFYESQMGVKTDMVSFFDVKKYSLALSPRFSLTLNSALKFFREGTLAECDSAGWGSFNGVNEKYNNYKTAFHVVRKHEKGQRDFEANLLRVKRIIEKCYKKDIKVLLVRMPVTSFYAEECNKEKLKEIDLECKKIDALYSNVKYLNLFQDPHFDNDDFHDTDHLNIEGAKKCTFLINNFIQ